MGGRHRSVQTLTAVLAYFASCEEWNECLKYIHEQQALNVCQEFTHWPLLGITSIEGELYSCVHVGVGADIV